MPTNTATLARTARVVCDGLGHSATITTDGFAALATTDGAYGRDTDAVLAKTDGTLEAACPGEAGQDCHGYLTAAPADFVFVTALDLRDAAPVERD